MKTKVIQQADRVIGQLEKVVTLPEISPIISKIVGILPDIKGLLLDKQLDLNIILKTINRLEDALLALEDSWIDDIRAFGYYAERDDYLAVHIKKSKEAKRIMASFYGFKDVLLYLSLEIKKNIDQSKQYLRLAEVMDQMDVSLLEIEGLLIERISGPIFR